MEMADTQRHYCKKCGLKLTKCKCEELKRLRYLKILKNILKTQNVKYVEL